MTELAGKNGRDKVVSRVIRFSKVGLCLTISRVWRHWGERFSLFRNWNFSSTVRRRIFCGVITTIIPTNPIIMCLFCLTILQNPIRTDQACLQWSCAETRSEILSRQEVYGKGPEQFPPKMSISKRSGWMANRSTDCGFPMTKSSPVANWYLNWVIPPISP